MSFASVNAYGLSEYSPALTELCVHGGWDTSLVNPSSPLEPGVFSYLSVEMGFPSHPLQDSIRLEWVREDFRPEFFGRAVVKLSWERPQGSFGHNVSLMMTLTKNVSTTGYKYLTGYKLRLLSQRMDCGGIFKEHGPYEIAKASATTV